MSEKDKKELIDFLMVSDKEDLITEFMTYVDEKILTDMLLAYRTLCS